MSAEIIQFPEPTPERTELYIILNELAPPEEEAEVIVLRPIIEDDIA